MAFIFADLRRVLSTTAGINALTVAVTPIYTVPAGRSVVVEKVVIRCTAANTITVPATAQVEKSSNPGSGNIFASEALTGLTSVGDEFAYDLRGKSLVATAGNVLQLNITIGATGTSQVVAVDVIGYFI